MDPRTRRRLWWALAVLVAILLIIGGFLATAVAQLSGGWDEVLDRSHPLPGDPEVVAAREVAAASVDPEVVRMIDQVVVPALSGGRVAVAPEVGAAITPLPDADGQPDAQGSFCEVGEHDWKIDDDFDLFCTETRGGVVAAPQEHFVDDMVALDAALASQGYTPISRDEGLSRSSQGYATIIQDQGLSRALEYWQRLAGVPMASGEYEIADLPAATYRSADGTFLLLVSFSPTPGLGLGFSAEDAAVAHAGDEYLAAISVSTQSYRD